MSRSRSPWVTDFLFLWRFTNRWGFYKLPTARRFMPARACLATSPRRPGTDSSIGTRYRADQDLAPSPAIVKAPLPSSNSSKVNCSLPTEVAPLRRRTAPVHNAPNVDKPIGPHHHRHGPSSQPPHRPTGQKFVFVCNKIVDAHQLFKGHRITGRLMPGRIVPRQDSRPGLRAIGRVSGKQSALASTSLGHCRPHPWPDW
jgi:hypothetical protein